MKASVVKYRCGGCNTLHSYRKLVFTASGPRCARCQPSGRVQLAQARKVEIERDAMRRSA